MTHFRFVGETHPSQTKNNGSEIIHKQLFYIVFKVLAFTLLYSR